MGQCSFRNPWTTWCSWFICFWLNGHSLSLISCKVGKKPQASGSSSALNKPVWQWDGTKVCLLWFLILGYPLIFKARQTGPAPPKPHNSSTHLYYKWPAYIWPKPGEFWQIQNIGKYCNHCGRLWRWRGKYRSCLLNATEVHVHDKSHPPAVGLISGLA